MINHGIGQKGRFKYFLKSHRKRTYAEIEKDDIIKEEELKELREAKLDLQDQVLSLVNEVGYLKNTENQYKADQEKLAILFDKGIIITMET